MTTEDSIIHIFCCVDEQMREVKKVPQAKLYPSEVATIGNCLRLKVVTFERFTAGSNAIFSHCLGVCPIELCCCVNCVPSSMRPTGCWPSLLNVIDSFPIELLFPIREGRSKRQLGTKNRDKGRWSIGIKLCWVLNRLGQVVGWHWLPMNRPDQDFLPPVDLVNEAGIVAPLLISKRVWPTRPPYSMCCSTWIANSIQSTPSR